MLTNHTGGQHLGKNETTVSFEGEDRKISIGIVF